MEEKTLKALKGSIEKWEKYAKVTSFAKVNLGAKNCPLCLLFNTQEEDLEMACIGCPVQAKTGQPFCMYTPYSRASFADMDERLSDFRTAARDEVDFLKSLLPAEEV